MVNRKPKEESGAALTEFALVVPLLMALIYGAIYLTDLGRFKLRAQEIARYTAWSMALRPLSDFSEFDHHAVMSESRNGVIEEVGALYRDLDGAREAPLGAAGLTRQTMAATYTPPSPTSLTPRRVDYVPGDLNAQWGNPATMVGILLGALGIGTGVSDAFNGMVARIGLNPKGRIRAKARVEILPPYRNDDAVRADLLASQGRGMGADLRPWRPRGQEIRDVGPSGARDIEVVLVAESWRLDDGATAHPNTALAGDFGKTVERISDRSIQALPLGPIVSTVLSLLNYTDELPPGLGVIFGAPPPNPKGRVFSRPYTEDRTSRPGYRDTSRPGQISIFTDTGGEVQEPGAVRNFETAPLYLDNSGTSPYLDALNRRGPYFMGCPNREERRCSAW